MKSELDLPPGFESMSMANKCEALKLTDLRKPSLLSFLNLAAQRNTVLAFAVSLRPAASGIQSYKNFCDFVGRKPFPVASDTILLRSGLFRPGGTFANYLAHVMKAAILMRQPTYWITADVRSVPKGLKNAQDVAFRFPNFMMDPGLLCLIRTVYLASEFGQAAFFSFLMLLRVPSETLQMRMAGDSDCITEFSPHAYKISVGARGIADADMLIAKFSWRKNCKRGCILRRPCLCDESSCLARVFCPVHQIWPRIANEIRPHGFLFPRLTADRFRRLLKSSATEAGIDRGHLLTSHCFRRGDTQSLQTDGASTDTLKSAGCWRGMGFRSYIDTQMTDALKIARLVARMSDSEIWDEKDGPIKVAL